MGTKETPGQFDCYDAAKPDEPMFILLARDPVAPFLVKIWADIRGGDVISALDTFNRLAQSEAAIRYAIMPTDADKLAEAVACAEAMGQYEEDSEGGL